MADYETEIMQARATEADSAVAEILKELGTEPPPEAPAPPAPAATVAPVTGEPPKAEPPPAASDADRGMLRLLEREGQVRDRESALEKRESDVNRRLAEIEAKLSSPRDPGDIRAAIEADPAKFFTEAGLDPEHVTRLVVAQKLGDKAPPEIKKATEEYRIRKEIDSLRQQIQSRDLQLEVERVRSGANGYVDSGEQGIGKYPALGAVAKVDRQMVANAVLEEIGRDAQERKIPLGGNYLSHEEAAKRVEARWSVFRQAFQPDTSKSASTNVQPPPTSAPTGAAATTTTPPAPRSAPPRRVSAYWENDRQAEVDAALAEAMAEYGRAAH